MTFFDYVTGGRVFGELFASGRGDHHGEFLYAALHTPLSHQLMEILEFLGHGLQSELFAHVDQRYDAAAEIDDSAILRAAFRDGRNFRHA